MTIETPMMITVEPGAFQKLIGYEIAEWRPDYAIIERILDGRHLIAMATHTVACS